MKPALDPALPERGSSCPPAFEIEAVSAGEAANASVTAHLSSCAQCQAYLASLQESRKAFLAQRPPELFLKQVAQRAQRRPEGRLGRWLALGIPATAVAAALLLVVTKPPDAIRFKGASFKVFLKREGMSEPGEVSADQRMRAGDSLRFSYQAPHDGYLLVLDLDSSGKATAFYPYGGAQSEPVKAGSPQLLSGTIVLDATPGPEWLLAVYSFEPLPAAPLLRQLEKQRGGTAVSLDCGSCRVDAVRLEKSP